MAAFSGEQSRPASLDRLLQGLGWDEFDLVAIARALISDPKWVAKIRD